MINLQQANCGWLLVPSLLVSHAKMFKLVGREKEGKEREKKSNDSMQ